MRQFERLSDEFPDHLDWQCKSVVSYKDLDKLKVEYSDGKKSIVQNTCGYDLIYNVENFFAFKMINRDLIPFTDELLAKLGEKNNE